MGWRLEVLISGPTTKKTIKRGLKFLGIFGLLDNNDVPVFYFSVTVGCMDFSGRSRPKPPGPMVDAFSDWLAPSVVPAVEAPCSLHWTMARADVVEIELYAVVERMEWTPLWAAFPADGPPFQILHLSEVLLFCLWLGLERLWVVVSWRGAI